MVVMIRGAGDIATGIALRLYRSGMTIVMLEIEHPLAIRRTVCFSEAIRNGETIVEGIRGVHVHNRFELTQAIRKGDIPVVVDPIADKRNGIRPDVFVDACLAKKNLGTDKSFAPIVIGVGPGFTAGEDCHAVIETMRGHTLGRVIREGTALPDTGTPGNIGGYTIERLLKTPCSGVFRTICDIGDIVEAGSSVAMVENDNGDTAVVSQIKGVLRGILPDNTPVPEGMKCGDVDPRCKVDHCSLASDKALAIGGGVLEAIMSMSEKLYKTKTSTPDTVWKKSAYPQMDLYRKCEAVTG